MKSKILRVVAAMFVIATLPGPIRPSAQGLQAKPSRYTIADLGTLGGTFSEAVGVDNAGSLAGFSTPPGDAVIHGFVWRNGVMTDLGTLGGPNSVAPEAAPQPNDRGQVVGVSDTLVPDPNGEDFCFFGTQLTCLPFLWDKGVLTPLPTLGGNNAIAWQVNNLGQVPGSSENATPDASCASFLPPGAVELEIKPVIWENGNPQELPTVSGDVDGTADAINGSGQAVGSTGGCALGIPFTSTHAVLWQPNSSGWTATDLGNLGGKILNLAFGINNRGQVVGQAGTTCRNAGGCGLPGDAAFHAFLWQNGTMTDLGTLPGDVVSWAETINNKDQAVGTSFDVNSDMHPFIWQDGVMTDLNALIPAGSPWLLLEALGNNDRGQIVGYGFLTTTGEVHAFVATPCGVAPPGAEGCGNGADAAGTGLGNSSERLKIVLPDNLRKRLQQRHGYPR